MKNSFVVLSLFIAALISGCATAPENIAPSYVSHIAYMQYSLEELSQEQARLQAAVSTSSDAQRKARSNDTMGVIFLGLPVSSLSGSNQASNLARLKGELEAVQKAIILKGSNRLGHANGPETARIEQPIAKATIEAPVQDSTALSSTTSQKTFKNRLGLRVVVENNRLIVADVSPHSAGENAGIQRGDQIVSFNGAPSGQDSTSTLLVVAGAINEPMLNAGMVTWQSKDGPEKTAKLVW
jgi:C-terminal processing protease CtpA/Prc